MPKVRLDFDLSPQLVLNVGLLKLGLEQHLQMAGMQKLEPMHAAMQGLTQDLTLRATTYCVRFSLARYTLPNFPLPKGLPMSKSESCHDSFCSALLWLAVALTDTCCGRFSAPAALALSDAACCCFSDRPGVAAWSDACGLDPTVALPAYEGTSGCVGIACARYTVAACLSSGMENTAMLPTPPRRAFKASDNCCYTLLSLPRYTAAAVSAADL